MAVLLISDGGHGGRDPGASYKGVLEKTLTLDIDNRVYLEAKRNGISVSRTRTGDTTLDPTPRANKVKASKAKYCFSHHINAFKPEGANGAEILVSQYNDQRLAKEVLRELSKVGVDVKRGVKTRKLKNGQDYYYMHRNTGKVTTLIIEYGFIDHSSDLKFLSDASNRQKLAEAVVRALCTIEGLSYKEKSKQSSKPIVEGDTYFRVVTESFKSRENAIAYQKKLKSKGIDSF